MDRLFTQLGEAGFTLSLKKSSFFRKSVHFLGFILDSQGIKPDPEHLEKIMNFPHPGCKQQLQAFLGVCGFYRRFSIRYANFIDPFRNLLQTGNSWRWTNDNTRAFEALKQNFTKTVTLSHYLLYARFCVQTDASDVGISGVLYQFNSEGNMRIILLVSRVLTNYESRYTTTEKELLAIIYSILKFRYYLIGSEFDIVTDHKSLTFSLSSPFHSARVIRWILALQEYNFVIRHCRGSDNIVTDFFSRHFPGHSKETHPNHFIWSCVQAVPENRNSSNDAVHLVAEITMKRELVRELRDIAKYQADDETIKVLRSKPSNKLKFLEENNVLYVKLYDSNEWKLCLPRALVNTTRKSAHEQFGHAGAYKLFAYLNEFFFWRRMKSDIKSYTKGCDLCQRVKFLNYKMEGAYQFLKTSEPNEMVSVDFYGPLPRSVGGVQYLFVLQDLFSKLVTIYAIKKANTRTCLNKLINHYVLHIGIPKRILSDHGTQFVSPQWKAKLESLGLEVLYSSIRNLQSNPVERTMREIGRILRTYCSERHTRWATQIESVQDCMNYTTHQSTGFTPFYLHFQKHPKEQIFKLFPRLRRETLSREVQLRIANEKLQRAFEQRCASQKSVSKISLKVGDLVLLRVPHLSNAARNEIHKFFHVFEGPYKIIKQNGANAFVLSIPEDTNKIKGVFNRLNLRPYYTYQVNNL